MLPLDFLTRTAVADSLFLIGTNGIFTAHLTGLSSANGGIPPPARTTRRFFGRYSGLGIAVFYFIAGLACFHLSSPLGGELSSEASYQVRKPPLIECCLEQAQATTFYRAQTDRNRLFEVKFRVTAAGLERTRPIVCNTVPAGTRQASSKLTAIVLRRELNTWQFQQPRCVRG